jgi:glycine betaine/proline transport system substrate-binding protein
MKDQRGSLRLPKGRRRVAGVAVLLAVIAIAAAAIAATATGASARDNGKPTITLATNSWEGSLANNVVAQYVIQKYLGYKVNLVTIDEIPAWTAMAQGKMSAVLEEWGHSPQYSQYIKKGKQVIDAGLEGPNGNIGWYIPTYLMKKHPELKNWKGVKKDWKMFVTPQSSPQGQFLDGAPSYVTYDQALVKNLKMNFKVVFAGSEAAQETEIETAYKAKKPILFYWYTPQYQNTIYHYSQVALPKWTTKCAKLKPAAYNCAYPPYHLYKVMASTLPKTAPSVANFLRRFSWTGNEQSQVAYNLAVKHMSNDQAAAAFASAHKSQIKAWLNKKTPFTKVKAPPPGP